MGEIVKCSIIFSAVILCITSCSDDDPVIVNEEEVITTLQYNLTPTDGSGTVQLTFRDLDGDGGQDPEITGGVLNSNTTYTGELTLLNEQENPVASISAEVEEEADEHQFFFSTNISGMTISYDDMDSMGFPVGLRTIINTGSAGSGILTIILRHEPAKAASNVSNGDIGNAGGETDIEVNFSISVE